MKSFFLLAYFVARAFGAALWQYEDDVTTAQRAKLELAWDDMRALADQAARQGRRTTGTGGVDDTPWKRYFPIGDDRQQRIQNTFEYLAGWNPFVGPRVPATNQRGEPHWATVRITTATIIPHRAEAFTQMFTFSNGVRGCRITIHGRGMNGPLFRNVQPANIRPWPSANMEGIGSVLLHELLHCDQIVEQTILYDPVTGRQDNWLNTRIIEDQPSPNEAYYRGLSYGAWPAAQLKHLNLNAAWINNDNYMYYALECYWKWKLSRSTYFVDSTKQQYKVDCPNRLNWYQSTGSTCNVQ